MRHWLYVFFSALTLGLASFGLTASAHADTITAGVYNLYNASVAGYSVTGTVTLNSLARATAVNLTFNDPNFLNPGLPIFTLVTSSGAYNGLGQDYFSGANYGTGQIALFFNTTANANGFFDLCLGGAQCGTSTGTVAPSSLQIYSYYNGTVNPGLNATNFSSGYLSSASNTVTTAVTPEPSSLLLLGTGIVVIPFVLRRRFRQV